MLSVILEDRSKDAWIAADWKQEWETSEPTRVPVAYPGFFLLPGNSPPPAKIFF